MQDHNEPEDFCRTCHCFFTLSQLRKIQDLFEVVYSDVGSNDRKKEENIIINWITYLRDSEGMFLCV